jgi:site-specific recombinase XerD
MSSSAADRRTPLGLFPGQLAPRRYDCVGEALRSRYHSRRTEEAYLHWIHRFLRFHDGAHPRQLAEQHLNRFPIHLAVDESVAATTQNQALAAVLFLYKHVLEQTLKTAPRAPPAPTWRMRRRWPRVGRGA